MLDLEKGRVAYAILFPFLGMGDKLFAVPFEALKLDATREHFTLDVDKDKLKNAPSFDKNHPPKASDRTWGAEVYKFYGDQALLAVRPGRYRAGSRAASRPPFFFSGEATAAGSSV